MAEIRARTSCEPCRKRKIKCDAGLPCSSCTLRNKQQDCFFQGERDVPAPHLEHRSAPATTLDSRVKKRRFSPDPLLQPFSTTPADIRAMKASVRQLQANIEALETKLEVKVAETDDPQERANWNRIRVIIPDKAVVEVLLEYLLQECDWLWQCRDIVALWQTTIARKGVSSSLAGLLCMSLAIPCLFLGPYQTPFYRLPIDTAKVHPILFEAARSFTSNARTLEELELLEVLTTYSVFVGRQDQVTGVLMSAMDIITRDGWLDENSQTWQDLTGEGRLRARKVLSEIVAAYKWSRLMSPDLPRNLRINLCRPSPPIGTLQAPIKLALPGQVDLPLRLFRLRSEEEFHLNTVFRDTMLDFSDVLLRVRQLLELSASNAPAEETLMQAGRLQQELQDWRQVRVPNAGLRLLGVSDVDFDSPAACHRIARGLTLHHAIGCAEGIVTRHWLTVGRQGSPLQQHLHDECLHNAQRSFDSIPLVRAMLATRHAPFVATFIICGLFNAATCFAIPLLRAVHSMPVSNTEETIKSLPEWPEALLTGYAPKASPASANSPPTDYPEEDIKRYANNILVVLDMLSVLNALPCGRLAQDRLERLVQQYDLRSAPRRHEEMNGAVGWQPDPFQPWTAPGINSVNTVAQSLNGGNTGDGWPMALPEALDPFPGMWDELLQLDPCIWEDLLKGPVS